MVVYSDLMMADEKVDQMVIWMAENLVASKAMQWG
jgi:hypothetical protein